MRRISGTLSLISFLGLSSQLFIIIPTHDYDYHLVKLLLPFNILLVLLYYNYYLTAHTDPGGVPKGWVRTPIRPSHARAWEGPCSAADHNLSVLTAPTRRRPISVRIASTRSRS